MCPPLRRAACGSEPGPSTAHTNRIETKSATILGPNESANPSLPVEPPDTHMRTHDSAIDVSFVSVEKNSMRIIGDDARLLWSPAAVAADADVVGAATESRDVGSTRHARRRRRRRRCRRRHASSTTVCNVRAVWRAVYRVDDDGGVRLRRAQACAQRCADTAAVHRAVDCRLLAGAARALLAHRRQRVVFALWQVRAPSLQRTLARYFTHNISSPPVAMVGSMFSHVSLPHIAFNMMALHSVAMPLLVSVLPPSYFAAFYLNCGMTSALLSHAVKAHRDDVTYVLCCAVSCCAVLCRAVPCRAVPCRAVPCAPCRAVLSPATRRAAPQAIAGRERCGVRPVRQHDVLATRHAAADHLPAVHRSAELHAARRFRAARCRRRAASLAHGRPRRSPRRLFRRSVGVRVVRRRKRHVARLARCLYSIEFNRAK